MRLFLLIILSVLTFSCDRIDFNSKLSSRNSPIFSFTELNLDWFGTNGHMNGGLGDETRIPTIQTFLERNDLFSDVMVFEEIVDLDLLTTNLLGNRYQCIEDQNSNPIHQHVVICHTLNYEFEAADYGGYELKSVDVTGTLRPAVHGLLKTNEGVTLAHIFAVHLKADPEDSTLRLQQVRKLMEYIRDLNTSYPIIILGDFNTYNSDSINMDKIFRKVGLTQLDIPERYSWASVNKEYKAEKFDRVWITESLVPQINGKKIVGPCNSDDKKLFVDYHKNVSDHCAISLNIGLQH